MKRLFITVLIISNIYIFISAQWSEDILGNGYQCCTINHPNDYSGKVVSTVIRKFPDQQIPHTGILYIHGYNDYFFQQEMGDLFAENSIGFYATDLRKYGRSIIDKNTMIEARDLNEYFADIDSAVNIMKRDGIKHIILMGHSTGGLILSLFAQENSDDKIIGLILNSPFLEWNLRPIMKKLAIPFINKIGTIIPNLSFSQGSSTAYGESLHKKHHGEWNYNLEWKIMPSPNVTAAWLRAIDNAQKQLLSGPKIRIPILLMHSNNSISNKTWNISFQSGDAVLNVSDISKKGCLIGYTIREATVTNGLHDLVLSQKKVRDAVYKSILQWIEEITIIYRQ